MPFRRRTPRRTRGKGSVKHAGSLISLIGPGTVTPPKLVIVNCDAGPRTEATQGIQDQADTAALCRVGDLVKYLNIHIQSAAAGGTNQNFIGWLEYAVVCKKEADADLSNAQLGTQTVGETCTNLYRNECLWTGFVPIGLTQSNGTELQIKIPQSKMFLKIGDEIVLFYYFRSQNAAAAETNANRTIASFNYKCYS